MRLFWKAVVSGLHCSATVVENLSFSIKCMCRMSTMMNGMNDVSTKNRARLNSILDLTSVDFIKEVNSVDLPDVGEVQVRVVRGDFSAVPLRCQQFIARYVSTLYIVK